MGSARRRRRRQPGGIRSLILLTEEHRAAFDYDWRTRFHLPASVIGTDEMSWGETLRLTKILRSDPASAVAAAIEGWTHATSREALVLMDLFDLEHRVNSKRPPAPHPGRPGARTNRRTGSRIGNPGKRTRADLVAHFRRLGHNLPD